MGTADYVRSHNRDGLRADAWSDWVRKAACVDGDTWPAVYPWVYELRNVQAFDRPVLYRIESLVEQGTVSKGQSTTWRKASLDSWVGAFVEEGSFDKKRQASSGSRPQSKKQQKTS